MFLVGIVYIDCMIFVWKYMFIVGFVYIGCMIFVWLLYVQCAFVACLLYVFFNHLFIACLWYISVYVVCLLHAYTYITSWTFMVLILVCLPSRAPNNSLRVCDVALFVHGPWCKCNIKSHHKEARVDSEKDTISFPSKSSKHDRISSVSVRCLFVSKYVLF